MNGPGICTWFLCAASLLHSLLIQIYALQIIPVYKCSLINLSALRPIHSVVQAKTEKSEPLESDGAFMLGNEQDCYGGCTDSTQAFYGLMDEVGLTVTYLCDPIDSPAILACIPVSLQPHCLVCGNAARFLNVY